MTQRFEAQQRVLTLGLAAGSFNLIDCILRFVWDLSFVIWDLN